MIYDRSRTLELLPDFLPCQTIMADNCLRVLHWNAGGLTPTKKLELENKLNILDVDVFAVVEANIKEKDLEKFKYRNYTIYCMDKSRQIASGILVGIRTDLTADFSIIKRMSTGRDKAEIVKINVWKTNSHFRIYSLYNPPNNHLNLELIDIKPKTVVMGDFNAHSERWGYLDSNSAGKETEDFIDTHEVDLLLNPGDTPTYLHYNGTTTNPDLIITSTDLSERAERTVLEDPGFGHRMVLSRFKIQGQNREKRVYKPSWNFRKANWESFQTFLETETNTEHIFHPRATVDSANRDLCGAILVAAGKSIPLTKPRKFKPFWNEKLGDLKRARDSARCKAEKTKLKEDVDNWRKLAKDMKAEVNYFKKSSFENFITNIDFKKDGKKTYRFLAKLTNKQNPQKKQPFHENNRQLVDDGRIAGAFINFYTTQQRKSKEMKCREKELKKDLKVTMGESTPQVENIFTKHFTIEELKLAIEKAKVKKSPGPDKIQAEFLKHLGPKALQLILKLFNLSWETSCPAEWKKAIIIPILKKNKPPEHLSSYRPICLTSILSKIMERMVNERLTYFLEYHGLIDEAQAGFRRYQSTNQQVTRLAQEIKDAMDRSETLVAVFVDLKAAYDCIWRARLHLKLYNMGIGGKMLNWIRSCTTQRYCAVRYRTQTSKYKQTHRGLQQGGVTSTSLFNVYINDLPQELKRIEGINCAMYADDLVIWSSATRKKTDVLINRINKAMVALADWCKINEMQVNTGKTEYQTFTLSHQETEMPIKYMDIPIRETDASTYLGVTFDKRLSWKHHISNISEKALKRCSILKRLAGVMWGCSRDTLNITYNMYIKPLITYCCEPLITCSKLNIERLEKIQNQALRLISGAVKTTPIQAMQILTNNKPIEEIVKEKALILFEKLIRLPSNDYWREYNTDRLRKLKTQQGFIQKVTEHRLELEISGNPERLLPMINPTDLPCILGNTELMYPMKKKDAGDKELHAYAMETIHGRYPINEWLHVYTDGSRLSLEENAGAGIYSELFSFYISLGKNTTHFDGEIEAINIATQQLIIREKDFKKAVILSDAISAIQAITAFKIPDSSRIEICRKNFKYLKEMGKEVVLQWIPAHCGIYGNEIADQLAKKGTLITQTSTNEIPFISISRIIKRKMKSQYEKRKLNEIQNKEWKNAISHIPSAPRRASVAAFRLATGHDCLPKHLFRFGILESPNCIICGEEVILDAQHLSLCPALSSNCIFGRYWEARDLMRTNGHQPC